MGTLASRRSRLFLLVGAVALLTGALASPLEAAPPPVSAGTTWNIPTGTKAQQLVNIRKMMAAIDGTKSGATIRMAFFSLTVQNFADKLVAAHKRGVNVKLIQDDHEVGPHWQSIVDVIGSDTSKRSWAIICHRSCFSDENPSYMHSKLYMFSKTSGKDLVVMVSSGNPTYTQARVGWNDMFTIVGDPDIYEGSKRAFEDMTKGALEDRNGNQSDGVPIGEYWFTTSGGKSQLWFYPMAGEGQEDDPMYQMLEDVECVGTASGYGSNGRTIIKVAMYQWSVRRIRLAAKLWRLQKQGCIVDVMYHQSVTDKEIIDELKQPGSPYGAIPITKAAEDRDGDGDFEHFIDHALHTKYVIINGIYEGDRSSKVVIAGSANWTNTALRYGNEITIQIKDNATYNAYNQQFATMKAWARSVPKSRLAAGPFPSGTEGGDEGAALTRALRESRNNEFLPTEWE